jgi:hypothetical protein
MLPFISTFLILLAMFLLTFISGFLPSLISNKKHMHLISIVGGGFMMGTALIIVLPESVKAVVDAN